MRLFVSTGEVSGDLQGALLVAALQRHAAQRGVEVEIVALGGERMAAAGATLIADTTAIGSVGIFEALPYLLPTLRIQRQVRQVLQRQPPDLAILIDYMNPNLVIGKFLRQTLPALPVVYYIAPQQWVWAFSQKDSQTLVANSDRMLAIFPAEASYFEKLGAEVSWVGHPLVDRFPQPPDQAAARQALGLAPTARVVTLLPASRNQEVKYMLPTICQAAQLLQAQLPDVQFLMPVSSPRFRPIFEQACQRYGLQAQVVDGRTQAAIAAADLAVTKSGTANLEIALMNVPQVVFYKLNPVSAWVARHLLKLDLPFASPVNLVEMQPVVPELLQWQATPEAIVAQALELLTEEAPRQAMLAGYANMRRALGEPGVCDRAAAEIFNLLQERQAQQSASISSV
ncbi:MAG: lipid-A-disaccharide synthase [Cyanobacteria bacterium Co-bin13]|nr:lipid-A-disaccharide synthase [Cyanobacteria bacterium Co-bin13]